jgi:putative heme-binding domain-containing protein
LKAGNVARDSQESILGLIATLGGPDELGVVFDQVMSRYATPSQQTNLLQALEMAARARAVRPARDLRSLSSLLKSEDDAIRATAARVAGLWKMEILRPQLQEYALAAQTTETVRRGALEGLTSLGGSASRETLEQLCRPDRPLIVRKMAVVALTALDLKLAAKHAVEFLAEDQKNTTPDDVYTAFMQRKGGANVLAAALAHHKLPADVAKVGVRVVRMSGREAPYLIDALTKSSSVTTGTRVPGTEEMRQLVEEVQNRGDPARGEAVYRRKDMSCMKCHAIAGAGGQVGPDLISIGASAQIDYLIESILLPNKAVKENYHALIVTTKDGRFLTGIKVRETNTELILRDAEDRDVVLPLKSIEEKKSGGSLMPEGLADPLARAELIDLVRFLSELGKIGPYSVSRARLVRRWEVLEPSPLAFNLLQHTGFGLTAGADSALQWTPAYSKVSGVLPREAIPPFRPLGLPDDKKHAGFGFVRCRLDVSTAGKMRLLLNSGEAAALWLDGVHIEAQKELLIDIKTGLHVLTFTLNLGQLDAGFRCELVDVPGSAAQVRIVTGK